MLTRTNSGLPPVDDNAVGVDFSAADTHAQYRLLTWLSPAFPVGAFAYSSGIEWLVEAGDIKDVATLTAWLTAMLTHGAGFSDAIFLVQAHQAAAQDDHARLRDVAELAAAYVVSRERRLETLAQGKAFMTIARDAWSCAALDKLAQCCTHDIAYPVTVGVVSAAHGVALRPTVHAFLHGVVSNWISAASRLVPLGQTDSQKTLVALERDVASVAERALRASLDDLGGATFRADIASMKHESQYTRLFRS